MLNDLNVASTDTECDHLSLHQNTAVSAASSAVTTALPPLLHHTTQDTRAGITVVISKANPELLWIQKPIKWFKNISSK
jgi:hypothetical protein